MATLANLVVEIKANSTKFNSNISKASKRIKAFATKGRAQLNKLAKVGFVALTGALVGMIALIKSAATEIDLLAKTAAKLGFDVAELQVLNLAAALGGLSTAEVNTGLQAMVRRLSDAAEGTGEAVKSLEKLGLTAQQLFGLSPAEQFNKIAGAMGRISDSGERVAIAFNIFGRSGVGFLNVMNGAMEESEKFLKSIGGLLSNEGAKGVEDMNDAITKVNEAWKSFKQLVTIALAPSVTALIEDMIKKIQGLGGLDAIAKRVADTIITGFNKAAEAIEAVANAIKKVQNLAEIPLAGLGKLNELLGAAGEILSRPFRTEEQTAGFKKAAAEAASFTDSVFRRIGQRGQENNPFAFAFPGSPLSGARTARTAAAPQAVAKPFQGIIDLDTGERRGLKQVGSFTATNFATQRRPEINIQVDVELDGEKLARSVTINDTFKSAFTKATEDAARQVSR